MFTRGYHPILEPWQNHNSKPSGRLAVAIDIPIEFPIKLRRVLNPHIKLFSVAAKTYHQWLHHLRAKAQQCCWCKSLILPAIQHVENHHEQFCLVYKSINRYIYHAYHILIIVFVVLFTNSPTPNETSRNASESEVWELEREEAQRVTTLPMLEPSSSLKAWPVLCQQRGNGLGEDGDVSWGIGDGNWI